MEKTPINKQLTPWEKRKRPSCEEQTNILRLQCNNCFYCGLPFLEWYLRKTILYLRKPNWDHVAPYSLTYNNTNANFVAACKLCNSIKSNKLFDNYEDATRFIRARLQKKGDPYSLVWGNRKTKRLLKNTIVADAVKEAFTLLDTRFATMKMLDQKVKNLRLAARLLMKAPILGARLAPREPLPFPFSPTALAKIKPPLMDESSNLYVT